MTTKLLRDMSDDELFAETKHALVCATISTDHVGHSNACLHEWYRRGKPERWVDADDEVRLAGLWDARVSEMYEEGTQIRTACQE